MKKIFLLNLILATTFCVAQVTINTPIIPMSNNLGAAQLTLADMGSYFKDDANKMAFWVGTWKYTIGNTEFKIVFTKVSGFHKTPLLTGSSLDYYTDILNGGYYYKENGIVKTDHLIYTEPIWSPLMNISSYSTMDTKLTLRYDEMEKPGLSGGFVHLTLLPPNGNIIQAKWEFDTIKKRNFSVPDNVILTKP
jgi:hypothetical protein